MIFNEKIKTQLISKAQVWAACLRVRSHHSKGSGADGATLEMIDQNPRKGQFSFWKWFLVRCYPTLFAHWQFGLTG